FLDSALRHPTLGRYSFVAADPFDRLVCRGAATDPFVVLAGRLAPFRCETVPGLPPFQGGAAGLFGYDLCHHVERLPRPAFGEFATPALAVGLYDWVVAFAHVRARAWLVSTGFPETDPDRRRARAEQRLRAVRRRLDRPPLGPRPRRTVPVVPA